jgi:hypothetical protein
MIKAHWTSFLVLGVFGFLGVLAVEFAWPFWAVLAMLISLPVLSAVLPSLVMNNRRKSELPDEDKPS